MGRFLDANGKATNDEAIAAKDPTGQPVPNQARSLCGSPDGPYHRAEHFVLRRAGWLSPIAIGGALFLTGFGFLVLTLGQALRPARVETAAPIQAKTSVQPASA